MNACIPYRKSMEKYPGSTGKGEVPETLACGIGVKLLYATLRL